MPFRAAPIELDEAEQAELRRRLAAATTPQRDARRAEVILLAAEGVSSAQIAQRVGMHESNIAKWRRQFLAHRLDGLVDAPRPGRPRRYGHDERIKIAAKACEAVPTDSPVPTWTYQSLADALGDDIGVSRSQLWRILDAMDLKPHMVRGWLGRRDDDPLFWQRVQDVCGLYLSPPQNALVLSVDEKTSIQARELKAPTVPAARADTADASGSTSATGSPTSSQPCRCTPAKSSPTPSPGTTRSTSVTSLPTSTATSTPPWRSTWCSTTGPATPPKPPRPGWPSTPVRGPLHPQARQLAEPG